MSKVSVEELSKHDKVDDLWVAINGKVYDFTQFAPEHPGTSCQKSKKKTLFDDVYAFSRSSLYISINTSLLEAHTIQCYNHDILHTHTHTHTHIGGEALVSEQAGGDGTEAFEHAHPESIMKLTMGSKALKEAFRGNLIGKAPSKHKSKNGSFSNRQKELETSLVLNEDRVPPIDAVLNLHDFASIAQNKMVATGRKQAWDYYSSGADDELTYNENVNAFQRIWLRPRILVNVKDVDMSSKILGIKTSMPLYLSAVAMCGMGHEEGEVAWTKAAGEQDIVFMVPNLSSKDFKTITDARVKRTQPLMFQIYVNPDREIVKEQVKACEKAGYKALCITVDSAVPGKRERDLRNKIQLKLKKIQQQKAAAKGTSSSCSINYLLSVENY